MEKKGKNKEAKVEGNDSVYQEIGGDPVEHPSRSSRSISSSSSHSSHSRHYHPYSNAHHKVSLKNPLLKLDVKFDLPMFNGDSNPKSLDNWIRQVDVYCCVQQINEEKVKLQLTSLWLEGISLVWWDRKLQDISKCGKLLSSWLEFKSSLRKQF